MKQVYQDEEHHCLFDESRARGKRRARSRPVVTDSENTESEVNEDEFELPESQEEVQDPDLAPESAGDEDEGYITRIGAHKDDPLDGRYYKCLWWPDNEPSWQTASWGSDPIPAELVSAYEDRLPPGRRVRANLPQVSLVTPAPVANY